MEKKTELTPQQWADAQLKLSRVIVSVITSEPFYATLVMQNRPKLSTMLPTAWVDRTNVYFDPEFLLKHSKDEMVGVMLHEVLHKVFGHVFRIGTRNPRKWNYVCDAIINDILVRQQNYKLPTGGIMLPESEVRGKSADQLYAEIKDDDVQGSWDPDGDMKNDGQHSELDELQTKQQVAAAVAAAKAQGKMPAGLERLIDELLNPKKQWKELLELALTTALIGNDRFAYARPSPYARSIGIAMPSLCRGVGIRRLVCGIDTSGSISHEELKEFVGELRGIIAAIGIDELHVVYCDARIHNVDVVQSAVDYAPTKVGGGGGTSFHPVFEYAEQVEADALVYMTDMYCDFPEEPSFPVIWGATSDIVGPYGTTIKIRD